MFIITKDYITKRGEEGYATGKTTFGLIETATGVSAPTVKAIRAIPDIIKAQLRDDDGNVYYDALILDTDIENDDALEELFNWGAYWAGTAQLYLWEENLSEDTFRWGLQDPKTPSAKPGDSGWVYTI